MTTANGPALITPEMAEAFLLATGWTESKDGLMMWTNPEKSHARWTFDGAFQQAIAHATAEARGADHR